MIQFHFHTSEKAEESLSKREGETRLGQTVSYVSSLEDLKDHPARYVLFGICEDIGVRANFGKRGAATAWPAFLNAFLNVQDNQFNTGRDTILLGHISVKPDTDVHDETPKEELGAIVSRIDKMVSQVVKAIVAAGKIPIAIGGGHNNAFGMIKGTAMAIEQAINVINIDAHTDLRKTDYRHSGNGFRYAYEHEPSLLKKYGVFGLHKNYTPDYIFEWMAEHKKDISYTIFEEIISKNRIVEDFEDFARGLNDAAFGLEIDCDSIENFKSSAQTPSGLKLNDIRNIISTISLNKHCCYFHLCEAAPSSKNPSQVGKALSYMVTDFIHSKDDY